MMPSIVTGSRIIQDQTLVDLVEDWSRVRSPGRARRRRRLGHPQNITVRAVPRPDVYSMDGGRTLIMHPEIARRIEREFAKRIDLDMEQAIAATVLP